MPKTNVFDAKTHKTVYFYHKNPIIVIKIGENENCFVKLTKIGIEIYNPFVYNVFIAAKNKKPQHWKAGPSRKEI